MSPRALKACPGCGSPVAVTPCVDCRPASTPGQHTRTRTQRGYDNRWLRLRAAAIRTQPWCADCGLEGDPRTGHTSDPANPLTGDHDVPLAHAPERRLDPTNVVVRCRRCNSRKGTRRPTSTSEGWGDAV